MAAFKLIDVIAVENQLGEGALWHTGSHMLWWTDILGRTLYRYHPESRKLIRNATPERLCSFAFTHETGTLIAAFESGIARYSPDTGHTKWLLKPAFSRSDMRFNDGHTDRQGRFWAGTMVEEDVPVAQNIRAREGRLFCLLADGSVQIHDEPLAITNAICNSPDGRILYFADSDRQTIFACDIDPESGKLSGQRIFARTEGMIQPDGAVADSEGGLWNAQWDGGCIVRYAPDGQLTERLELPVSRPTSLAFGGEKKNLLFVTSARDGLPEDVLLRQPMAGNVLVFETDVSGTTDAEFAQSLA